MRLEAALKGRRILLVEDEYYQAKQVKALLERAGAEVVGPTAHADEVRILLASGEVDAALIDINLGRGADFSVARSLRASRVPLLIVTGFDSSTIPADLADIARIQKPADEAQVLEKLVELTTLSH